MSRSAPSSRVYVGNLPRSTRERDLEDLFYRYYGIRPSVKEGFGFIEFDDYRDAEDAVKDMDGYVFEGRRLAVEHARPSRTRLSQQAPPPRDNRSRSGGNLNNNSNRGPIFTVEVTGIASTTSWQSLKDFARLAGPVSYADVRTSSSGKKYGIIHYSHKEDAKRALRQLDDTKLDGCYVRLYCDDLRSRSRSRSPSPRRASSRSRSRSKSPKQRSPSPRRESRSRSRSPVRRHHSSRSRSRSPPKHVENEMQQKNTQQTENGQNNGLDTHQAAIDNIQDNNNHNNNNNNNANTETNNASALATTSQETAEALPAVETANENADSNM